MTQAGDTGLEPDRGSFARRLDNFHWREAWYSYLTGNHYAAAILMEVAVYGTMGRGAVEKTEGAPKGLEHNEPR